MENSKNVELKRVLSLGSLIFYGVAFMIPLAFFTTYGIVANSTHGMVSLTYLVTTVCMLFTAYSYCNMTKAYPVAGSVYTYAQKAINPYIGFLSGWLILLGYMFLPMLNYLASAIFLRAAFPEIPLWVWIVAFVIIVTTTNILGIKVANMANKIVIWVQIIFLVALAFILIKFILSGGGTGRLVDASSFINIKELFSEEMGITVILSGASILALAFLGFDGISTLSEEAIRPDKDIPRAIVLSCIIAGSCFIFFTYLLQLAWPSAWYELSNLDGGAYELIFSLAGQLMAYFFVAGYVVGCIAASISAVASASRVLYGMGRDKILPEKIFAYLNPRFQTPTTGILIMGLFGFTALFFKLETAACLLNFGALLGFTIVNLCVIAHYFMRNRKRSGIDIIKYLVAPLCGAAFTFALWMGLDRTSMMLGAAWTAIGIVYLAFTTKLFKKIPTEMQLEG